MLKKIYKNILSRGDFSGKLLIIVAFLSLFMANTPFGSSLEFAISREFTHGIDFRYIVNEILMTFFFLSIGLEIKHESVHGELSSFKKASLPIYAAIGGVITPALIYYFFNYGTQYEHGWAISIATDIAFSLTILSMLKGIIPTGVRIVLATLAVVDDIIGIIVIAIFYSPDIHIRYLLIALGLLVIMFILNKLKVKSLIPYILCNVLMWYLFHKGGIHPTLSGVICAMMIPAKSKNKLGITPLTKLSIFLIKPVNYLVMPLFAFVNTNIFIDPLMIAAPKWNLFYGIFFGLAVGKPLGIFLVTYITVKMGVCKLPKNIKWKHILGVGIISSIGFTVSIFIAILSFGNNDEILEQAKLFIVIESIHAAIVGYLYLKGWNLFYFFINIFKDISNYISSKGR